MEGGGDHLAEGTNAMTYATVPSVDGEWYFVTDGQWIEGGDMSKSTARAIASRLNEQAAEIERLKQACVESAENSGTYQSTTALRRSGGLSTCLSQITFRLRRNWADQ
jgi:hypothetical protein